MTDKTITVISYSGYRAEEIPRAFFLGERKIEIIEVLDTWIEEGLSDRARQRFFRIRGSDNSVHEIYLDEKTNEWHRCMR
jgi:hypothetical protein